MPETERLNLVEERPVIIRMPFSEAMMSCRKAGHLQKLMIKKHATKAYTRGYHYGVYFYDTPESPDPQPYSCGYTMGECGIREDEQGPYAYHPDLTDSPEKAWEQVRKIQQDLNVVLVNAGAVTINNLL